MQILVNYRQKQDALKIFIQYVMYRVQNEDTDAA